MCISLSYKASYHSFKIYYGTLPCFQGLCVVTKDDNVTKIFLNSKLVIIEGWRLALAVQNAVIW